MAGRRQDIHLDGPGHREDASPARCRIGDWRSRAADRPLALSHPRSRRGMDSPHRQALRLRLLGGSRAGRIAGSRAVAGLAAIFQQSRDHGLEPASLDQITREWAPRLGLSEADVRSYLTENIYYHLDPPCLEGLQLFYRYAAEIGALPAAPEIDFLGAANAACTSAQSTPAPVNSSNPNASPSPSLARGSHLAATAPPGRTRPDPVGHCRQFRDSAHRQHGRPHHLAGCPSSRALALLRPDGHAGRGHRRLHHL